MALTEQTRAEMMDLPHAIRNRAALLPMLHLAQSVEGYVTPEAIIMCAGCWGSPPPRSRGGVVLHDVQGRAGRGVPHRCASTPGCGILGGDAIWDALSSDLGVGHDEVTEDGKVSLERIECQAACTHAPVLTANWEFMDNMTVESARQLVEDLREGVR